jgi:hypothetical protein
MQHLNCVYWADDSSLIVGTSLEIEKDADAKK